MKKSYKEEELKKYFLFAVVFLLLFLSFKIIQPYLIIILSAFILAYLVLPLYNKLNKKLSARLSAVICVLLILAAVLLPLAGIVGGIINQASLIAENESLDSFVNQIEKFPLFSKFNINLDSLFEKITGLIVSLMSSALSYLPSLIVSLIVLIFGVYYILIGYDSLSKELKDYLPFEEKNKIAEEIDKSTRGIIYGSLLVAIIQFLVAAIGFYISGVDPYLFLSLLVFFLAFLPGFGPAVVWIPLAIYYGFVRNWFALVGVCITGVILSVYLDTILRTKILGEKSNINPFIMLIGILGGISVFGVFGFVIGPLILIYSVKILREYFR